MKLSIIVDGTPVYNGFHGFALDAAVVAKKYMPSTEARKIERVIKAFGKYIDIGFIGYIEIGYSKKKGLKYVYIESRPYFLAGTAVKALTKITKEVYWFYENGVFGFSFRFDSKKKRR